MRSLSLRTLGGLVLAWALLSGIGTWRTAATRGPDRVTALETEFSTLSRLVPAAGTIGYLEPYQDADSADNILEYYVAQYAFAPRLVVRRTDQEFLIVAPDAARPGGDDRLVDFVPVATLDSGHRLYQRRPR